MSAERKALRAAERAMDQIYEQAQQIPESDQDDWQPSPPKDDHQQAWNRTLDVLDSLRERLDTR